MLVKKWSEALLLYERVLKYAKEVQSKARSLNHSLRLSLEVSGGSEGSGGGQGDSL